MEKVSLLEKAFTPCFDYKEEFISFLEKTLIPDLFESGNEQTARDFQEAVYWLIND